MNKNKKCKGVQKLCPLDLQLPRLVYLYSVYFKTTTVDQNAAQK